MSARRVIGMESLPWFDPVHSETRGKGNVVARVVENVRSDTLTEFVREAVSNKVSLLCTDQWVGNKHLGDEFPHASVDHARGEYVKRVAYYEKDAVVVGAVHTNTLEGFWSIFKRRIVG